MSIEIVLYWLVDLAYTEYLGYTVSIFDMAKKTARSSHSFFKKAWLAIIPHEENGHHPHAIRHSALALYVAALLTFNLGYNVVVAKSSNVLGFATAISQQEVIRLTNVERAKAGVGAVRENTKLDQSAMAKAQNMFAEDYWAHYAPSGKSPWYWFDQAGYVYAVAGENLARDFDTSQGVINGWMNSKSHRENMLSAAYQDIGIAVLNGKLGGQDTTLVVQHFGTVSGATSNNTPSPPAVQGSSQSPGSPQALQPTQTPASEQSIAQENINPEGSGVAGIPTSSNQQSWASLTYQLLNPLPINGWSVQQIVVIALVIGLMLLFVLDFAVLHRKGINRPNSHSLLHAAMMGVAVVVVIYSTAGGIL